MFLRSNLQKIVVLLVFLSVSLLIVTEQKATSKVTWEEVRGAPLAFLTITEFRGPCGPSEGGICSMYFVDEINYFALLMNVIGLYLIVCILGFGYERVLAIFASRNK
jgi:hypothetical protein